MDTKDIVHFIFKHLWLFVLSGTIIKAFRFRSKSRAKIEIDPQLESGYNQLFQGYLFFINIPWIIMGIGMLTGKTSTVIDYLYPHSGNNYVLSFNYVISAQMILAALWIYFLNGAELLAKHPGLIVVKFFNEVRNPTALNIKLYFPWTIIVGIVLQYFLWNNYIPELDYP